MSKEGRVIPFRGARRPRGCPICGRAPVEKYRPFCSQRCADVDLGRWLKGTYRVPTEERPDGAGGEPEDTG